MNLRLDGTLSAQDYYLANLLHYGYRPHLKVAVFFFVLAISVQLINCGLNGVGAIGDWRIWLVIFVSWAAGMGIYFAVWPASLAAKTKKYFARSKELHLPFHIEITDGDALLRSEGRGEWRIPFSESQKWKGNEKIVVIYASPNGLRMFPRRWFASDADFNSFKELLTKTIGPMGKARKISS